MAVQQTISDTTQSVEIEVHERTERFTRYWFATRSLMLFWLLLSVWQIGAYPIAGSDEALGVLMGFRLASAVDEPGALLAPFVQGQPPLAYLPGALGVLLLPVDEFTVRLPYALIGALQMPLLLVLVNRVFGRGAALFAGALLLGTGFFALNRLALGLGVFMTFELAGLWLLVRYTETGERRWIVLASLSALAATLACLDGALLLVVTPAVAWWARRSHRDAGVAAIVGSGLLVAFIAISLAVTSVFSGWTAKPFDPADNGMLTGLVSTFGDARFSIGGIFDTWLVYLGVPVLLLVVIGVVEAVVHMRAQRQAVLLVLAVAAATSLPWVLIDPRFEHLAPAALPLIAVAGFGWMRLIDQLDSVAVRTMVALTVVAVAMSGVVWNQAVFNAPTEFTADLEPLVEYTESLDHGRGLVFGDLDGMHAVGQVLREETEPGDQVFVRDEAMAAAVGLYSARTVEVIDVAAFAEDASGYDGAFLVIEGEDESFNAGLSGATTVVTNHRIFDEGDVLYQVVEFDSSGEPFETPIWWRSGPASARLLHENTSYSDFLPESATE